MATARGAVNDGSAQLTEARPHSFVLADLFNVEAMSLDVPEHVLEHDPFLETLLCPDCGGHGWQGVDENGWNSHYWLERGMRFGGCKPCHRCHASGSVLDYVESLENSPLADAVTNDIIFEFQGIRLRRAA
jgi:hypothetical protein